MKAWLRKFILVDVDFLVINGAFLMALYIRFEGYINPVYLEAYRRSWWLVSLIALISFALFELYKSLWRYASITEVVNIFLATSTAFLIYLLLDQIFDSKMPNSVIAIAYLLTLFGVSGSRLAYRILRRLRYYGKSKDTFKRVLIIGAGDAGAAIIKELQLNPTSSRVPVACVDDASWKRNSKVLGVPVKGVTGDILDLVKKESIDEIIIAIPSAKKQRIKEIVAICKQTGCKLSTLPSISAMNQKVEVAQLRDVDIIDLLGRDEVKLDISGIRCFIEDQIVLITGGGGSIGSEICRQLIPFKPKRLLILDIYENNAYDLQQSLKRNHPDLDVKVIIASVRDKERICEIFDIYKPSIVFHAAAHKHVPFMEEHPSEAIKNNIMGTLNVAQCAHDHKAKRFILISTDKAVNPTNIMGATKRVAELIIQTINQNSDTEFVAVRFGNVLGSNGSVIPLFKDQIKAGGPVTITHPDITRYFMTIPEASRLVIQAGAIAKGGEIFVLDMGEPVKILDLATQLIELSGYKPYEDIKIDFVGLRPGEKLFEELLLEEEGLACTKQEGILIAKPSDKTYEEVLDVIHNIRKDIYNVSKLKSNLKRLVPSVVED